MSSWPRVGVVGGSLGGLTAALVLRDLGCEVDVFERSSTALKARGAGIATHPATTRYFEESSELDASLVEIELPWLQFLSASGELVYRERMNYRFSSWTTVYRGLMGAFGERRYHLDSEVVDFAQDDRGVTVRFATARPAPSTCWCARTASRPPPARSSSPTRGRGTRATSRGGR